MMEILNFNHIGINIKDYKSSLFFYKNILHLEIKKVVKMSNFTITYLAFKNGQQIELFDYYGNNNFINHDEPEVGYRHIAIEVDNIEEWEKHLRKNNITILTPCTDFPELDLRVLLFKDPNGIIIEFCKSL